jgi:WD40 repeat protein
MENGRESMNEIIKNNLFDLNYYSDRYKIKLKRIIEIDYGKIKSILNEEMNDDYVTQPEGLCVKYNNESNKFCSCFSNGFISVTDIENNKTNYYKVSDNPITNIDWVSDKIIVLLSKDYIYYIHSKTGKLITKILNKVSNLSSDLLSSQYIITGGDDGTIRTYDNNMKIEVNSIKIPQTKQGLSSFEKRIICIKSISSDLYVIGCMEGKVLIFDKRNSILYSIS